MAIAILAVIAEGGSEGEPWVKLGAPLSPWNGRQTSGCRPLRGLRSPLLPLSWGSRLRLYAFGGLRRLKSKLLKHALRFG